jgi:GntR family transcriptional regulator / MocR family aminotransferase
MVPLPLTAAPIRKRKRHGRSTSSPETLVLLDAASATPLWRQVYDAIRTAITAGQWAPGARLPATRVLAADLRLSRNTIAAAFDQLRAEGYIKQRVGAGSFVADVLPDTLLTLRIRAPGATRTRERPGTPHQPRDRDRPKGISAPRPEPVSEPLRLLSRRGRAIATTFASLSGTDAVNAIGRHGWRPPPFRTGVPALDEFPRALWSRLAARRWRKRDVPLWGGAPGGEQALRSAIRDHVASARGVRCEADQVVVVNGSQQALDFASRLLLDPGDEVWMEDPGYPGARVAFQAAGAELVPIPCDIDGMNVEQAMRTAPRARLAYVTPSHQFPLGGVMNVLRRRTLLRWAADTGAWIIEDDYDSEYRYASRPLPSLQGLDTTERVIYVGTFSKTLFPALRIAYLVVPPVLVESFIAACSLSHRHVPTQSQLIVADFLADGHFHRHVRRMRALYEERQTALLENVKRELDAHLDVSPAAAGMHLVAWLRTATSDIAFARAASIHGLYLGALSRYAMITPPTAGVLLGYAAFPPVTLRKAVVRLARALSSQC